MYSRCHTGKAHHTVTSPHISLECPLTNEYGGSSCLTATSWSNHYVGDPTPFQILCYGSITSWNETRYIAIHSPWRLSLAIQCWLLYTRTFQKLRHMSTIHNKKSCTQPLNKVKFGFDDIPTVAILHNNIMYWNLIWEMTRSSSLVIYTSLLWNINIAMTYVYGIPFGMATDNGDIWTRRLVNFPDLALSVVWVYASCVQWATLRTYTYQIVKWMVVL